MPTTNCTDDFFGYLIRSVNDMKIVDRVVRKVYRFKCPNCQSRLEGESKELLETKIEPEMALSFFYSRLDTVRRLP